MQQHNNPCLVNLRTFINSNHKVTNVIIVRGYEPGRRLIALTKALPCLLSIHSLISLYLGTLDSSTSGLNQGLKDLVR